MYNKLKSFFLQIKKNIDIEKEQGFNEDGIICYDNNMKKIKNLIFLKMGNDKWFFRILVVLSYVIFLVGFIPVSTVPWFTADKYGIHEYSDIYTTNLDQDLTNDDTYKSLIRMGYSPERATTVIKEERGGAQEDQKEKNKGQWNFYTIFIGATLLGILINIVVFISIRSILYRTLLYIVRGKI
jgi:hypothetical protein